MVDIVVEGGCLLQTPPLAELYCAKGKLFKDCKVFKVAEISTPVGAKHVAKA